MSGQLATLYLAAAVFLGLHLLPSSVGLRRHVVRAVGERAYLVLFSLVSIAALVWLLQAYGRVPQGEPLLWQGSAVLRVVAAVLVAIAFILLVPALMMVNPTAVGGERALRRPDPAHGISRVTRHPMMWGIVLWGIAHLLNRNDIGAIILFGSLTVLALVGTVSIDRKKQALLGDDWSRFAAMTSNLPFLAIAQGRNHLDIAEIGWWRILITVVAFAAFYGYGHAWLFGVSPLPGA